MEVLGGVLGGLGSGLISAFNSNRQQKLQNAYNERMWHMQNEYDTPKNQMKRLKEAGLNPYLFAEGLSGGNSANAPMSVAGYTGDYGVGDAVGNAMNYANRQRELKIKQQQTDLNEEVIRNTTLDGDILSLKKQMMQQELTNMKNQYTKTQHDIMLNELSHALNVDKNEFEKQLKKNLYILELQKYKGKKSFDANLNIGPFGKIGGSFGWSNF